MKNLESGFNIDNTYLLLNKRFYTEMKFKNNFDSSMIIFNDDLASELNLNKEVLKSDLGLKILSGSINKEIEKGFAQAYSGHQFAHFTNLGDGRALMIGEHVNKSSHRFDIQLKGSGPTPYSRRGDGKATLSSMLREYLVSEAVHYLNIPTARSLAVVKTNEKVMRETLNDAAILTRIAKSHIRVGSFEYAFSNTSIEEVKQLADYTINRHYKELNNDSDKYFKFLNAVIDNQAALIASWQSVGFIHGVMNTDNVLISGQTIDYGPCAFMDVYQPKTVFSSIDRDGRYAYLNQPYIASWNMARFAETLLQLISDNQEEALELANKALQEFGMKFSEYWLNKMGAKIGIVNPDSSDKLLIQELLNIMEAKELDFTNTFRFLTMKDYSKINIIDSVELLDWIMKWKTRLNNKNIELSDAILLMEKSNPNIIARNHLLEEALKNASLKNDYTLYYKLLNLLKNPFDYSIEYEDEFLRPDKSNKQHITYCGT